VGGIFYIILIEIGSKMGCSHSVDTESAPSLVDGKRNNKKNKILRRPSVDLTEAITEKI
jgi:hypothetical protein